MGMMSDADILIDEMQVWSTAELMDVWANSDDAAERYAARHVVIERGRAEQRFWDGLLEYGEAHPEKARMIES